MDIAATVNPATGHFRSLTDPSRVKVLEQNCEYDLLEPDKLLRKDVGREVTLMRTRQDDGTTRQQEVKALLLSYNAAPVWKIGNEIVTGIGADHIRFPELPSTLYSRPMLIWTVANDGEARQTLNVKIGNAFDVVCERSQVDFERISGNVYELEYEVTLRNHKATAVSVEVNEPLGGTWRMIRASHECTKTAAWAARFTVPVAADGTAALKYRVRVTY